MRVVFCLVATLWFGIALGDTVTPSDRVVNGVNVRERATSSSPAIHLLRPGDVVDYVATEGRWYEIRLEDGRLGFVSTSWTDRHRAEAAPPLTAREQDELRVHYLDVGNGTCTVIECPAQTPPRWLWIVAPLGVGVLTTRPRTRLGKALLQT